MSVSRATVLLGAALLQVTAGARITRGLVGSGYGSSSGGSACKFWCESGGGNYHCCQTPQQTALVSGGSHLQQTSGGYGNQGFGHQSQISGGYGNQGFGHQSQISGGYGSQGGNSFGNNFGQHGSSNNFGHQGNSFGSQGGYGSQATHGNTGFRPTHTVTQVVVVRPIQGSSQGGYGSSQGISQGGFRPTHGVSQGGYGSTQGVSQGGFRPTQHTQGVSQGGYGSNSNTQHRPQANSLPQGHSSNFVANPSIVTPLGHNDAISTVGNNNLQNADSFAFQGTNQGPSYPFDLRIKPNKS